MLIMLCSALFLCFSRCYVRYFLFFFSCFNYIFVQYVYIPYMSRTNVYFIVISEILGKNRGFLIRIYLLCEYMQTRALASTRQSVSFSSATNAKVCIKAKERHKMTVYFSIEINNLHFFYG